MREEAQDASEKAQGVDRTSVRRVLLMGVFWRILFIEGILLVGTLGYESLINNSDPVHLAWYAVRILLLVGVIILFMLVTLQSYLNRKIILPLELIAAGNRRVLRDEPGGREVVLPPGSPREMEEIVATRSQMLNTILRVSEERQRLVDFIRETFGRYISKKVVDEILELPERRKVGGQRRTVTVLMSDLRGFTSLSDSREPEEMVGLLNRYLERMTSVILAHGGMIDEFIGDAILVVFGVPDTHPDDAARAVACGIAMQNALAEMNELVVADGYPPLEMGIGINSGPVIVGNIGSEARMKYGIVGNAVNKASRIEANTTGGQVLIGEDTYRIVREMVMVEEPLTVMTKGLRQPLVSYPVRAVGHPFNQTLQIGDNHVEGVEIHLPFRCWVLQGKTVTEDTRNGETIRLAEDHLLAQVSPPLHDLSDVKLVFDFCADAHCFGDVYAKVVSTEPLRDETVNRLKITYIDPRDQAILRRWMSQG